MDHPATIGRYEVLRVLGQGGMGRVFLARDSVLRRLVAVKIVRDDLGIPPEVKTRLFDRMRQEARAAAALSHPNMVTLHDMGEEERVGLFLVFEYIDGPTLRDRIAERRLSRVEVADLARALGSALAHAHAAGVIHRDVKPENVMLAASGPKLTDFGLARLPDSTLTAAGSVLGTPAYSAPEALALGDFSALSDQFSLASTLYEALAGKRAFVGDDALMVATRVAMDEPIPLTAVSRALAPADAVVARALSKEKAKRFASCAEFGDALAKALAVGADTPSLADTLRAEPPPAPAPRSWRRQNLLAAAGVIVIVGTFFIARKTAEPVGGVSLRRAADAFATAIREAHQKPAVREPRPSPSGQAPPATASTPSAANDASNVPETVAPASSDAAPSTPASEMDAAQPAAAAPSAEAPRPASSGTEHETQN